MKVRTIITQDAEVDDQNSLRHFLLYCNEVELLGIVQTSSKYHWRGVPGTAKRTAAMPADQESASFHESYRWTGTDWMFRVIDDYEKDYPNLIRHADGYPTPEYLRSITKIGNVGCKGDMEAPSDGSELIRKAILDGDDRKLYLQVWGGCNTIARALMDIQTEFESTSAWPELHEKITQKVVITACGEQDETYRTYIAEQWPGILFVKTLQMKSYAYPWFINPECDSKDTLRGSFMLPEILNGKCALTGGYCTWLDGKYYEGEGPSAQFGANPNIVREWFGAKMGLPTPEKYDFLSEGDSPTFFPLLNWGFRTLEDFSYGGIAGRYHPVPGEYNSKGEALNIWDVSMDSFTDRSGNVSQQESMWPYVADIQRDFAARAAWADAGSFEKGEHPPKLSIQEGLDFSLAPGETAALHAAASSPDGLPVSVSFRLYRDASAICADASCLSAEGTSACLTVPLSAAEGDMIHIIVKAQAEGHYRLTHYQQIIVRVK